MSHKPENHPIAQLHRLIDSMPTLEQVRPLVDALETERNTLTTAWREKHQALNVANLRIAYLERMLEIAHDQNERDRAKIMELCTVAPPVWRSH